MIKSSVVSQTCGYRTSFGNRAVEAKFLKLAEPLLIGAVQAVLSAYSPKVPRPNHSSTFGRKRGITSRANFVRESFITEGANPGGPPQVTKSVMP